MTFTKISTTKWANTLAGKTKLMLIDFLSKYFNLPGLLI